MNRAVGVGTDLGQIVFSELEIADRSWRVQRDLNPQTQHRNPIQDLSDRGDRTATSNASSLSGNT